MAALFVSLALAMGSTATIGVFLPYMATDLNWSRTTISGTVALFPLVNGILQPAIGWLVQRVSPLLVLAAGSGILGAALYLTQSVSQPWHLFGTFGILAGVGVAASSLVVASALINRWFTQRRGLALGVASAGLNFGRLVLVPVSGWMIVALGWRPAWSILGTLLLVGAGLCLALYLARPRGIGGDGVGADAGAQTRHQTPGGVWWRHGSFWRLSGSYGCCGFSVHLVSAHLPGLALERGMDAPTAALALGLGGGLAALGTVAAGWAADTLPQRHVLALAYVVRALALVGVALVSDPGWFVALAVVATGTFLMTGNLTVGLAGTTFGIWRAPMIFGFIYVGHQVTGTLSILLGGMSYDLAGSYAPSFLLAAALLLVAAATAARIQERVPVGPATAAGDGRAA